MQERSWNSAEVKFFKLDFEKAMRCLEEYARRIVERGAIAVILIGSLARGDYTAFSDADLIIVSDNVPDDPLERLRDFMDPTLPIDLEPRVYTRKEFLEMAKDERRIIGEVLKYGILLAGDKALIIEAKKLYFKASPKNNY